MHTPGMVAIAFAGFDWDAGNREKCRRHGLSITEIEAVFPDAKHSTDETRFIGVGRTGAGRPVFIAFALRRRAWKTFVRPITARYMHRKEIESHEKESSKAED
jgi:uncharacterized DUF497 family protein